MPDNEVESTGVRPNEDGTFQLRKSINIYEDEKAEYDCYVSHTTLKEPIIKKWDGECLDCSSGTPIGTIVGALIGVLLVLAVIGGLVYFLANTRMGWRNAL